MLSLEVVLSAEANEAHRRETERIDFTARAVGVDNILKRPLRLL